MKIVGMVPSRSGSAGVPGKNVRLLCGRPLLSYSVEAALQCPLLGDVYLNSDSDEHLDIGRRLGAQPYLRDAQLALGDTSMKSVVADFVSVMKKRGEDFDGVAVLYPTYPLRTSKDISEFVGEFIDAGGHRSLIGLKKPGCHPYMCYSLSDDGSLQSVLSIDVDKYYRRQDYPEYLEMTAWACVVPATKVSSLNAQLMNADTIGYVISDEIPVVDIDTSIDFRVAECLLSKQGDGKPETMATGYSGEKLEEVLLCLPRRIGALILDFDGVMTDNRVLVFEDGTEAVVCNRSDGWGLQHMHQLCIPMLVLSTEKNPVVKARSDKLDIECIHGVEDKKSAMLDWLQRSNIDVSSVVYVGNDVNDADCLRIAGCGVAVADAHPLVKQIAQVVLSSRGGHGAVREVIELIQCSNMKES